MARKTATSEATLPWDLVSCFSLGLDFPSIGEQHQLYHEAFVLSLLSALPQNALVVYIAAAKQGEFFLKPEHRLIMAFGDSDELAVWGSLDPLVHPTAVSGNADMLVGVCVTEPGIRRWSIRAVLSGLFSARPVGEALWGTSSAACLSLGFRV